MHDLELGNRIKIKSSDSDGYFIGTFLGIEELSGCDFLILDVGDIEPMRINAGFIVWIQSLPAAAVLPLSNKKRHLRIADK